MPRVKDPVWNFFNCTVKEGNKGLWATCKKCKKELQGIVPRMKKHLEFCSPSDAASSSSTAAEPQHEQGTSASALAAEAGPPPPKIPRMQPKLTVGRDHAIIQTSPRYAKEISTQIAKFFYEIGRASCRERV